MGDEAKMSRSTSYRRRREKAAKKYPAAPMLWEQKGNKSVIGEYFAPARVVRPGAEHEFTKEFRGWILHLKHPFGV
jgi:hypothetical protein